MRVLMRGSRGFSLVEVLVAFALLITMGTTLFNATSGAARNSVRASEQQTAARWVQTRLASLGLTEALVTGVTAGRTSDGYSWEQRIERIRPAGQDGGFPAPLGVWITLSVWPPGVTQLDDQKNLVSLSAFKLVAVMP